MRKKRFSVLIGVLVLLGALTMVLFQAGAGAAQKKVNTQGGIGIQLLFELPKSPDGTPGSVDTLVGRIQKIGSGGYAGFQVDWFFDIAYASNIGSSGEDGVSRRLVVSNIGSSGQDGVRSAPDSSFDVFYEIDFKRPNSATIETEIVAMQLRATVTGTATPAGALDAVRGAVKSAGGDIYVGHVTILK